MRLCTQAACMLPVLALGNIARVSVIIMRLVWCTQVYGSLSKSSWLARVGITIHGQVRVHGRDGNAAGCADAQRAADLAISLRQLVPMTSLRQSVADQVADILLCGERQQIRPRNHSGVS